MSKSSDLDKTVKAYILDCIDATGYDKKVSTNEEKVKFLFETFYSEKGYDIARANRQNVMEDYLRGLPSCLTIEFANHNIIELAKKWGSISESASEKEQDKLLENYWRFMAAKTCQLFTKYKVEV